MAGTANGLTDDEIAGAIDYRPGGTIFELLNCEGISWANYHHVPHGRLYSRRLGGGGSLHLGRRGRLLVRHFLPHVVGQVRGEITLLIWLYHEHGGYYDHVPPPPAVEPDAVLPHSLADRPAPLQWLACHSTPGP